MTRVDHLSARTSWCTIVLELHSDCAPLRRRSPFVFGKASLHPRYGNHE